MRRWVAVLAFGLVACSQPADTPVARVSTTPTNSTPSPVITGASPEPEPSPTPPLPVNRPAFACRLPVYAYNGGVVEDAFISFPSGTVTPDPSGKQGMYYDRKVTRWVPVSRQAVSPDGNHYAEADIDPVSGDLRIHIIDVRTGVAKVVHARATGMGAQPVVFDYAPEGIYLTQAFEHIWPGVWLFNPSTGAVRKVADLETPELSAGRGVMWYGRVNPLDPSPVNTRSSAGILPDEVNRYEVATGRSQRWLYRPGSGMDVLGLDLSGRPVIRALVPNTDPNVTGDNFYLHDRSELLIALSATRTTALYKGQAVETLQGVIADSHGLWFGGFDGIYLYTAANGLQRVSDHAGLPANGCF